MWDLFTSADFDRREQEQKDDEAPAGKVKRPAAKRARKAAEPPAPIAAAAALFSETRNEDVARAVAAREVESGGRSMMRVPAEGMRVGEVNAAARELIEGVFPPLWVHGEIANFTKARSGHCYFSLRDADAQIRCVMWRDEARRLPTTPAEGMQVRALGRLTLYEQRGEFQLVCFELEAKGEGLYKLAMDRLRATLDAEGLTSPARKRPIPAHPACVGVVTSSAGAALRDIVTVIRRRAPWTRIVLAAARVQGEGAAEEIARAVRLMARAGCADVLIVGRGGGSIEDLWAFNEEVVARAIADSPVPVISAVGHETDFTIADLVADLRAPTPSAAAEAAVPDGSHVRRELDDLRGRMASCTRDRIADGREAVFNARLDLQAAAERGLRARRDTLSMTAARLQALSPLNVLARGYAVPLGGGGRVLRGVADFAAGARFDLRVADGVVPCRVDQEN
ncbi:MAG TPA: exodeoxyribonuclease VII large subunit [Longimicrobium sp.]|nr:exodeoxyribonuclease VII large subunit [Longimicrobium sp.]HSU14843.1 exodeoxyribonuclease VII large subunit [Longimicrobium sp.]